MRRHARAVTGVLLVLVLVLVSVLGCVATSPLGAGPTATSPTADVPAITPVAATADAAGPAVRMSVWGEVPKQCA